ADPRRVHARADRLDHAGPLVAHDDGCRPVPLGIPDVQVGVAHARGEHPHPDLALTWLDELELADDDRLPDGLENGRPRLDRRPARHRRLALRRSTGSPPGATGGPPGTIRTYGT